ncbi:DUF4183 domain-containing protein [Bacillus cereus group sp. Bc252]|uniref:DUF4183 domain-containing protein n=1 Tax=Bacillus TaxID=1386 RepID=UPI0021D00E68|nr:MULTISPECIES: DUF4183 domain-containing protein [Bacillus cereus group]MCU5209244.1 DUF4183 domain-containing protein [Bacillus paranthracis]MDA2164205.1 DUF4183 domain-containing protein [Bacillus cereus group sp. Bc252]MDF9512789.1 DUF4183 domain-containing protein [Bacillus paranthracis]MDF9672123.1 DUF4183 domain-containing protein [Bacillus paranthracis]MDG1611765.1 DUF4183 domain-containing protein [Bacillus paranthracis]
MPLQLMKPIILATTTTGITPTNQKFFHVTTTQVNAGSLTLSATQFVKSDGTAATVFPSQTAWNLYVNGVPQMQDMFSIQIQFLPPDFLDWQLIITLPVNSGPILKRTPIILEFVEFTSSSTTIVTS